jgi:Flp pilus assembly CpaF family ATPase
MERSQREALIGNLANRSSRAVDTLHSRLSCDLPYYRVRVQAFCPPVSDWPLMLRVHAQQPRRLRDRWAAPAALPQRVEELEAAGDLLSKVEAAIARRDNILISGNPGAGKSTNLSDLMLEASLRSNRNYLTDPTSRRTPLPLARRTWWDQPW